MKKLPFFHLGFLCLILTLITNTSPAFGTQGVEVKPFDNVGMTVIVQGLNSEPIEAEFANQREGSEIVITITAADGTVLYEETTVETELDYSSLNLPEGLKMLTIQIGNDTFSIEFE